MKVRKCMTEKEKRDKQDGVRIDIWTHLMRECIMNYVH